ncbi:MAG: ribonuclease H-like domain-containing protein [Catonella sp.]|nr:ribonuclease H-like domain-containing protein [Catonella sp.]MDY6355662.1 ribonuclease H-like domain-containing protein [Catonella sp.]
MYRAEETFRYEAVENLFPTGEKTAWFDIETTGLSYDVSKVYLIGIAERSSDGIKLTQLFADTLDSEVEILTYFTDYIKNVEKLIHYNGDGFDLPFVRKRCARLNIPFDDSHIESIDIYKKMKPYKELFGLQNLRQPTVEAMMSTDRVDETNGGELIEVYSLYIKYVLSKNDKADDLRRILLLHNHDDVKGLVKISRILEFDNEIKNISDFMDSVNAEKKEEGAEFIFELPYIPSAGEIHKDSYSICMENNGRVIISVPVINEELKLFYSDYRNYRYLINEDKIIHKSIAQFMDKSLVRKVKASECYTGYRSDFIPVPIPISAHTFVREYKGKEVFLELNEKFTGSQDLMKRYCGIILKKALDNHKMM